MSGALEPHARVLPVAEVFDRVDVLVGKIDAARVADLPVDDGDLAVIAVVVHGRDDGDEGVELDAVDAHLAHGVVIVEMDLAHAADVVVHEMDFDPLFHLAGQNVEDGIPEFPLLDDEELEEDVLFGARSTRCAFRRGRRMHGSPS